MTLLQIPNKMKQLWMFENICVHYTSMCLFSSGFHRGLPQGPPGTYQEICNATDWESGDRMGVNSTGEENIALDNLLELLILYFRRKAWTQFISTIKPKETTPDLTRTLILSMFPLRSHRTAVTRGSISTASKLTSPNTKNLPCVHQIKMNLQKVEQPMFRFICLSYKCHCQMLPFFISILAS